MFSCTWLLGLNVCFSLFNSQLDTVGQLILQTQVSSCNNGSYSHVLVESRSWKSNLASWKTSGHQFKIFFATEVRMSARMPSHPHFIVSYITPSVKWGTERGEKVLRVLWTLVFTQVTVCTAWWFAWVTFKINISFLLTKIHFFN